MCLEREAFEARPSSHECSCRLATPNVLCRAITACRPERNQPQVGSSVLHDSPPRAAKLSNLGVGPCSCTACERKDQKWTLCACGRACKHSENSEYGPPSGMGASGEAPANPQPCTPAGTIATLQGSG